MSEKKEYKPYKIDVEGLTDLLKKKYAEELKKRLTESYPEVFDKDTFEFQQCDLKGANAMFKEVFNELIAAKAELAILENMKRD
jgi:S-ribosylhomocysteine lyase LuxS involved in autoinducer biosynthesis